MRTTNSSTLSLLSLLSLSAVLTGAAAGCDTVEEDLGEVTLRPWGCTWCGYAGGNSANINGASLANIHLTQPFGNGMSLGPLSSGLNIPLRLGVDPLTDSFVGHLNGQVMLSGADMVGAKIPVNLNNTQFVWLEISEYDNQIASWSNSGATVTAYKATYFNQGVPQQLCPSTNPENQWFTLIPDERYSAGTNEVESAPGTVTIACVGEAAAKMKLFDFHPHGNRQASVAERQATLRMVTADYCGNGHSFTVNGTQVAWRDAAGQVEPMVKENVLEALWDENGAICLNKPRHASIDDVADVCGEIPMCDSGDFVEGVVWRTMLPK